MNPQASLSDTKRPNERLTPVDLDSLCSTVVAAYLRSNKAPYKLHIPLSNLPREDLKLRTEMSLVLKHAGLEFSDLLTLSELSDLSPEQTEWFLVDHNALTGSLKKYQSRIVACIDHHVDDGVTPKDASPRVIEHCGSAMSLVVTECQKDWQAAAEADNGSRSIDAHLAKLGLAPILIDTINLTAKEKMCEKDTAAVEFLVPMTGEKDFDRTKYHDEITAVKEDISSLSFRDVFRKDYKEWTDAGLRLGISCVVQNFDYLLQTADDKLDVLLDEFRSWATERSLDIAVIMTTSHPGGDFQRHLLVWATSERGTPAVNNFIQNSTDSFQLTQWKQGKLDGDARFAWQQHKLTASRKQVAPALRDAMVATGKEKL